MTNRRAFIITDRLSFIMRENHSCDTYVGRFPGADGATVVRTSTGAVVPLAEAPAQVSADLSHSMRQGYIDHTTYDVASLLPFVEKRFGQRPLTCRDAAAADMAPSFDLAAALLEDAPIITRITHCGRYVTIHIHTVAASAAALRQALAHSSACPWRAAQGAVCHSPRTRRCGTTGWAAGAAEPDRGHGCWH